MDTAQHRHSRFLCCGEIVRYARTGQGGGWFLARFALVSRYISYGDSTCSSSTHYTFVSGCVYSNWFNSFLLKCLSGSKFALHSLFVLLICMVYSCRCFCLPPFVGGGGGGWGCITCTTLLYFNEKKFVFFILLSILFRSIAMVLCFAFSFWGLGWGYSFTILSPLLTPPADIRGGWSGGRAVRVDRERVFSGVGGEQERQARQEEGRGRPAAETGTGAVFSHDCIYHALYCTQVEQYSCVVVVDSARPAQTGTLNSVSYIQYHAFHGTEVQYSYTRYFTLHTEDTYLMRYL